MEVPSIEEIGEWLSGFPDSAMRGAGMGDLSIINRPLLEIKYAERQNPCSVT
ncbi:MAG: hypothetical protein QNJ51_14105 [Calothrix sp. MO_167.B12]|nr:hypothetical protein [Calothrix sp. MO_167.B12]